MLNASELMNLLKDSGISFFSGVPCSFLKRLIDHSMGHLNYVAATNEGEAVAICAGADLAGRKSAVLMQNSGLTNALSPLTSLDRTFRIPVLGLVSLRGEPGISDEPQHELLGRITSSLLSTCGIEHDILSQEMKEAIPQVRKALACIDRNEPYFFIVRKGTFGGEVSPAVLPPKRPVSKPVEGGGGTLSGSPTRLGALEVISSFKNDDTAILACTGKTGRELFEIGDSPHNLYMVGSMGCVSSIGLGVAICKPEKRIIAIDGDGALLMRMGSLATNGYYSPKNMLHILLDNHSHDSTGGQSTVSQNVKFANVAAACGYPRSVTAFDLKELERYIEAWKKEPELTFIHLRVQKGSKKELGRPTIGPAEVAARFRKFLEGR